MELEQDLSISPFSIDDENNQEGLKEEQDEDVTVERDGDEEEEIPENDSQKELSGEDKKLSPLNNQLPSDSSTDVLDNKIQELSQERLQIVQKLKSIGGQTTRTVASKAKGNEISTRTLEGGSHWDYLLKEMSWMSNDFRTERKWKVQSSKKLSKEIEKIFQKKEVDIKKERQTRISGWRKQANRVAREVKKGFWEKVDRIVLFKNNADYLVEQQQTMDRNLDRLLGQTERYTNSLVNTASALARKRKRNQNRNEEEERKEIEKIEKSTISKLLAKYSNDQGSISRPSSQKKRKVKKEKWSDDEEEVEEDAASEDEESEIFSVDEDKDELNLSENLPIQSKTEENESSLSDISGLEQKFDIIESKSEEDDVSWKDEETSSSDSLGNPADDADPEDDGDAEALAEDLNTPIEELIAKRYGGAPQDVVQNGTIKKSENDSDLSYVESSEQNESDDDGIEENVSGDDGNVNGLNEDMDIPIEELLKKRYGIDADEPQPTELSLITENDLEDEEEDESWNDDQEEEVDDENDSAEIGEDEHDEEDDGNIHGLNEDMDVPIEELLEKRYGIAKESQVETSAWNSKESDSNLRQLLEENPLEDNDDSFSEPTTDDADDEETLLEAERLGGDCTLEELQNEANMPLEELLSSQYQQRPENQNKKKNEKSAANEVSTEKQLNGSSERKSSKVDTNDEDKNQRATRTDGTNGQPKDKSSDVEDSLDEIVPVPLMLSQDRPLREYQREGLNWLVSMHNRQLNGILADEMGLGKTAQTIALLAHLAGSANVWGPHLVVVPTSVILNWDVEFKMWCPGLKVMTYFGSNAERTAKRTGWTKPNAFHVCITSYQLAVQDASVFRRKKWYYIICDEAHALKNSKSQRWQTLLSFQAKRRLLLTGTPLQNSLMELWSLMHFLMPQIFRSQHEFKHWFSNPLQAIVEEGDKKNTAAVKRLHAVMRPFILRRLKRDVATQLPKKYEHVVRLPLARRQRFLYEDFISRSSTQAALKSGGYLGMMSVLMKLRMVCNHPDLFEPRLVTSSFCVEELDIRFPRVIQDVYDPHENYFPLSVGICDREFMDEETGVVLPERPTLKSKVASVRSFQLSNRSKLHEEMLRRSLHSIPPRWDCPSYLPDEVKESLAILYNQEATHLFQEKNEYVSVVAENNTRRILNSCPTFGRELVSVFNFSSIDSLFLCTPFEKRLDELGPVLERFVFVTPNARGTVRLLKEARLPPSQDRFVRSISALEPVKQHESLIHPITIRQKISFPDRYLIQYDCGKLQTLAVMLQRLKQGNHRVLIFTQMTRMLDILERFLNLHSMTYFRLDGSTKVEDRQSMMERFNRDRRVFCFILSTRSGGLGINLTGADTVIFYDSDWNPSMDAQAQDRAHRIGQTKNVHIYRLVSEQTIEENILLKSNQKRHLNRLSVEEGNFSSLFSSVGISEDVLAEVEDESDRLAAQRAKEEEIEMLNEEGGEEPPEDGATTPNDDKIEDEQGNVLMSKSQYQELEAKLKGVDMYAIDFRTYHFQVIDKLKEARHRKELQKAQLIEEQTKDWELEVLEHDRNLAEQEAEDGLIADKESALSENVALAVFENARRAIKLERKLLKLTGRAWKRVLEKPLPGMPANPNTVPREYYFNEDTKETSWERPRILDAEVERKAARTHGWGALSFSVLSRIAAFVFPSARQANFHLVCLSWWKATCGNVYFSEWVDPSVKHDFLTVGSRVEGRHKGEEQWFAGTVIDSCADGTFTVMYSDGDIESHLTRDFVRKDCGGRLTIIRSDKLGGPIFELNNPTICSDFACGTTYQVPKRYPTLEEAFFSAKSGHILVVRAGRYLPKSQLSISKPGIRIVGESFFVRELGLYDVGMTRLLPDDDPKKTPQVQFDSQNIHSIGRERFSLISSPHGVIFSSGGEICGLVFACPVSVSNTRSLITFKDCLFTSGLIVNHSFVRVFGCHFVNSPTVAFQAKNMSRCSIEETRFLDNNIGIQFDASSIPAVSACELRNAHNVQGPALLDGTKNRFADDSTFVFKPHKFEVHPFLATFVKQPKPVIAKPTKKRTLRSTVTTSENKETAANKKNKSDE